MIGTRTACLSSLSRLTCDRAMVDVAAKRDTERESKLLTQSQGLK